ncbi:MAG TPA: undecaprenyl-diphosphate phosphatase [Baekduia sp.]|nr:undecaprenyl-diphosphate phosphatase [Baekduia sp.]
MSSERPRLPLSHAVALGAMHGPAELVPVSSSAHVTLIPQLLGWPYASLPADVRKAFEVALHAGTLVGMLLLVPRPSARFAVLSAAPAAATAFALEGPIEQRLGGVRATAAGLVAGSALLVLADAVGGRGRPVRHEAEPSTADAVVLGAAQAAALWPGVSRLGVTVAAARLRGFERGAAFTLGRQAGLPIVAGATALKAWRLARRGLDRDLRRPFAAGMAAALASTLAAAPLRRTNPVGPVAAERLALAGAALLRLRRSGR